MYIYLFLMGYRALLMGYRALLMGYRALLMGYRHRICVHICVYS